MFVSFVVIPSGVTFCMDINCEKKKWKKGEWKKRRKEEEKVVGRKVCSFAVCTVPNEGGGLRELVLPSGSMVPAWLFAHHVSVTTLQTVVGVFRGGLEDGWKKHGNEIVYEVIPFALLLSPPPCHPPQSLPPFIPPHPPPPPPQKKSFKKCEKQQHGNGVVCKLSCSVPLLIDLLGKRRF